MNLILLFPEDFLTEGRVRLSGRRLAHVQQVHRAAVGDELRVGLAGGKMGMGRVTYLDGEALELEVSLTVEPPAPLPVTLLLALPRPLVLKRTLQSVTAMGVKKIVLLHSNRVEKSFWQSQAVEEENLHEQLVLGLEQARDTVLPQLLLRKRFRPFVEDELPAMREGTRALVAHPVAAGDCPRQVAGPVTLAVGPEGGLIPYEIEKLTECGFAPVTLGERILRVETAVPALLSRLF